MVRLKTTALLSVATAATLILVTAPGAGAGVYTLLKESSRNGVTARLWLNNQTRGIHAQALGLERGEMVRLDADNGRQLEVHLAQSDGMNLDTKEWLIYPQAYSACAGSPVGGSRFICTPYHHHNG
jgi:hypothetical protein